jgi:siroheme synthase (precorrin-2 oxidase/ferrochelatase)
MAELSDEVRRSIEKSLESADDTVAELTLQRSAYEKELENVKQELDFARTIAGNDTLKVESLRQTLLTRQKASATELNELQRLLAENE